MLFSSKSDNSNFKLFFFSSTEHTFATTTSYFAKYYESENPSRSRRGTPAGSSAQPPAAPPTSARPPRNKTHHEALHYLTRPWSPTARANADSSPSNGPSSGATQLTGNVLHKLQGDVISGLGRVAGESISRCSGLGDEAESQRKRPQNDRPACF